MKFLLSLSLLTVVGISLGEVIWWNNARHSYPQSLVSQAPAGANDLASLRKACGSPLEIEPLDVDTALVRCGTVWPFRSIWLVPKDQIFPAPK